MREETERIICSLKDLAGAARVEWTAADTSLSLLRARCGSSQSDELPVAIGAATEGTDATGDAAGRFGEAAEGFSRWLGGY